MIVFEDSITENIMSFGENDNDLFFIEIKCGDEPSEKMVIQIEDNEVQHLINVLTNHLHKKK